MLRKLPCKFTARPKGFFGMHSPRPIVCTIPSGPCSGKFLAQNSETSRNVCFCIFKKNHLLTHSVFIQLERCLCCAIVFRIYSWNQKLMFHSKWPVISRSPSFLSPTPRYALANSMEKSLSKFRPHWPNLQFSNNSYPLTSIGYLGWKN